MSARVAAVRIAGVVVSLIVSSSVASSSVASAGTPEADAPGGPYTRSLMVSDAISTGVLAAGYGLALRSDPHTEDMGPGYLMLFGGGGYLCGPAVLHHEAGRDGTAVASVALRAGLPIIAGLTANALTARNDVIAGSVIAGAGLAMLIDWTLLARPSAEPASSSSSSSSTSIVSGFGAPIRGGGIAGLAGSF